MADDPTTTGPNPNEREGGETAEVVELPDTTGRKSTYKLGDREVSQREFMQTMRALPGANVTEWATFDLPINGKISFTIKGGLLTVSIELDATTNTAPFALELPPAPLQEYGDPETLNNYLAAVKRNFIQVVGGQLQREAARTLQAVCIGTYVLINPGSGDRETIIEDYTKDMALHLSALLAKLPPTRKPGGWSKIALRNAVMAAALRLALRGVKGRALTLEAVRDEMWPQFGELTPASGEALRKQMDERKLNWRALKRLVTNYAADVARGQAPGPESENGG